MQIRAMPCRNVVRGAGDDIADMAGLGFLRTPYPAESQGRARPSRLLDARANWRRGLPMAVGRAQAPLPSRHPPPPRGTLAVPPVLPSPQPCPPFSAAPPR